MLEMAFFAMFAVALTGSLIAGIWDLKTTEIPDEIPTLMAGIGIFFWFVFALTFGSFYVFFMSMAVGLVFLVFGWVLYKAGQWGGGDAKLMAAIGCLVPTMPGAFIFSFSFFSNVFFVGAAYVIAYSVVIGFMNRDIVVSNFVDDLSMKWKRIFMAPVIITAVFLSMMLYFSMIDFAMLSGLFVSVFLIMVFWRYARVIEKKVFMKEVPASSLREGDVLRGSKIWDGLTAEEAARLRKTRKKYVIKEGVRFGPVFCIALVITIAFGNLVFIFF